MKSILFLFILLLFAACSFSQISYEKGYFITNDNRKTDCLIKNDDWKNNPTEFLFKAANSDMTEKAAIASIKEFGIYNFSKYIRAKVKIDRSSDDINSLTDNALPAWSDEELFLKVLFNGKASLYYYRDDHSERFFYSISDTSINQLIYRKYLDDQKHIVISSRFRQQLWLDVKCSKTSVSDIEKLNYSNKDLENYFISFNKCMGDSSVDSRTKSQRDWFNLKIAPGINFSSINLSNSAIDYIDFNSENKVGLRIGIESEFILPFNKNKWGLLIEPSFQYLKAEMESYSWIASINYFSIEFPLGLRYYLFLNNNSKIFINGIFIPKYSLNFNSEIDLYLDQYNSRTIDIVNRSSFAFGGGFEYKRASAEIRYYANRELLGEYQNWFSKYTRLSVILGYKIFKKKRDA
jgi:hypothetical protein